jgi:cardiolipin synthase (CMP-forming)
VEVEETRVQTDRVLTIPNLLSLLRIVLIPVFAWLMLGPNAYGWAAFVLVVTALSDYLDGKLARRWHQISRLGQLLDPIADRLTVLVVLLSMSLVSIVPWWWTILLLARDVVLAATLPLLRRRGLTALPVHFLGKAATFNLLLAFPCILWGTGGSTFELVVRCFGWAFMVWGTVLYWWAGLLYLEQVRRVTVAE